MCFRYCSRECQVKHWKHHKISCQIDSSLDDKIKSSINGTRLKPPKHERDLFKINSSCTHGGPSPSFVTSSGMMYEMASFLGELDASATASMPDKTDLESQDALSSFRSTQQLNILTHFCESNEWADNPKTLDMLLSMAIDSFGDNQGGVCRIFLRAIFFIQAYQQIGIAFLTDIIQNSVESWHNVTVTFVQHLKDTSSRAGMILELQKRSKGKCNCMIPKS